MKILSRRNSVQGMIMYYVSLYGFVGSCIALSQGPNTWKFVGLLLTLIATLIQDNDWFRRSRVHPHDKQLIEKMTELLQASKSDLFLRNHNFQTYVYDDSNLNPLLALYQDWRGVEFEFVNAENQAHWLNMRQKLSELLQILTEEHCHRGSNFYHLLPAPADRNSDPDIQVKMERAKHANKLARSLFDDYQKFRQVYISYTALLASP